MRTEQEIREEQKRVEKEISKNTDSGGFANEYADMLNIRKWALIWVLGEER